MNSKIELNINCQLNATKIQQNLYKYFGYKNEIIWDWSVLTLLLYNITLSFIFMHYTLPHYYQFVVYINYNT